jgi:hypothetical protein
MPRSGTKLLRDLLNRNPRVSMPTAETHFIPFMVNRFGMEPGLEKRSRMDEFYRLLTRTAFFLEMESMGISLARKELDEIGERSSWAAVLEFLLRRYAPQSASGADHLFGDKTPGYLLHLPLLKTIFPKARFLHIIRDPRDYALSVRKAWGKSIYRAADSWVRCIDRCREDAQPLDGEYLEIRFESLLEEPETILRSVCVFIDCVFSSEMLTLERPAENLGDAKDEVAILRTNRRKFKAAFSTREIRRIEEIAFRLMHTFSYPVSEAAGQRSLGAWSKRCARAWDGFSSVRFHVQSRGLVEGVRYFALHHQKGSWHN